MGDQLASEYQMLSFSHNDETGKPIYRVSDGSKDEALFYIEELIELSKKINEIMVNQEMETLMKGSTSV